MDHTEIISIFKSYYADALDHAKARIDKEGQLPKKNIENITKQLEELDSLIESESDDIYELLGLDITTPEESPVHEGIAPIIEKYELKFDTDSNEYRMMKEAYKYARRNYFRDLLDYNKQVTDYSLLQTQASIQQINNNKPEYQLLNIITRYMEEDKAKQNKDSTNEEKKVCLLYLVDLLGDKYPITKIDAEKARYIREQLFKTPKNRNTKKITKGLTLKEQIKVGEDQNLEKMSTSNIDKYITCFKGLFSWATELKYIEDNPFGSMKKLAASKANNRYEYFNEEQIKMILNELDKRKNGLACTNSRYWGTLISIYTGARRNEVASLLPSDIKKDDKTGIWYFDITDEEETKDLKTQAARRVVPIHSALLARGILDFVEQAKELKPSKKHKNYTPRLLYDMTYHKKEKWGRNLGRFVNEKLLPALGLKTDKQVLHSLRHSFITYLSSKGVDAKDIKSMAGHEQDTVTFGIYAHFDIEHLPAFKEAIEKLPY